MVRPLSLPLALPLLLLPLGLLLGLLLHAAQRGEDVGCVGRVAAT